MTKQSTALYSLEELLYMLSGDTTVMSGLLLENENVRKYLTDTIHGKISYDQLLAKTYEEF